jgi:hypothetical protein
VRVEPVESDGRYRCDPDRLSRPLGAWPTRAALQPVVVAMGQHTRWFVWPLPKPEQFLDLASTRQVIEHLMRIGISQSQYDDLVGRLGAIDDTLQLPPLHRQRLQGLLDEALKTGQQLDACVRLLRDDPRVQAAVEEYKREVGEEFRRELEKDKDLLRGELKELEAEKAKAEAELEAARQRLADEEAQKAKIAESVADAVVARARQATKDVRALLAEVAVLRPFLGGGAADGAGALAAATQAAEALPLATPDDAFAHLREQLENVGLRPPSAAATAREVVAALSLGQAVFFQGSLAGLLARTAAASLSGGSWTAVEIPSGLTDPAPLRAVLAAAAEAGRTALVLGGANRSPIDDYGADLVRLVAERAAGLPGSGLRVLGVLSDGLNAAPPDAVLSALGPILHADYLDWKRGGRPQPARPGQLADGDWPHRDGADEPALADLLDALQPAPNELWRRNALSAFRRLRGWPGRDAPDPLASALYGWVLPRALAAGVEIGEHEDALKELLPDGDEIDPRLQRLLRTHGVEVGV